MLNTDDLTVPDIVAGEDGRLLGSVVVVNCSSKKRHLILDAMARSTSAHVFAQQLNLEPFSIRKTSFTFQTDKTATGEMKVRLRISDPDLNSRILDEQDVTVRVRKPDEQYKRTFISGIDGSVQYYAVCPALKPSKSNALVMTVHGASVEAIGQAAAYKPKDWCTIVAPTNRRPYGFDWEDWGRMDAMEVWDIAKKEFPHDPKRVILTGHSMGGHGAWTLGLTYPNEFAAIGPSAGWISFWSYAGGWEPRDATPVEQMLRRSMNSSDTLLMLRNALMENVFILHGDKDDNVPVEQARTMKAKLEGIGAKFEYHEQPGAGHWWGNECVDWPPMFDMFEKSRYQWPAKFQFTTVNPGVAAYCRGVTILQQLNSLLPSSVSVDSDGKSTSIKTVNVAKIRMTPEYGDTQTMLDGKPAAGNQCSLVNGEWVVNSGTPNDKNPSSTGPFKLAFRKRMMFVVGTHGTTADNEWAANKARFDSEQWYYRGNGAVDIIADDEVGRYRDRDLILFGNAKTNSAFKLLGSSPVSVTDGRVSIGGHEFSGDGRVALYLAPEGKRLIAAIAPTGEKGERYADRLPYFTSGVAYPDWTLLNSSSLKEGTKAIEGAGFFGNDWRFDPKQSAFK
jgi:predicted peptidase